MSLAWLQPVTDSAQRVQMAIADTNKPYTASELLDLEAAAESNALVGLKRRAVAPSDAQPAQPPLIEEHSATASSFAASFKAQSRSQRPSREGSRGRRGSKEGAGGAAGIAAGMAAGAKGLGLGLSGASWRNHTTPKHYPACLSLRNNPVLCN